MFKFAFLMGQMGILFLECLFKSFTYFSIGPYSFFLIDLQESVINPGYIMIQ